MEVQIRRVWVGLVWFDLVWFGLGVGVGVGVGCGGFGWGFHCVASQSWAIHLHGQDVSAAHGECTSC